MLKKRKYFVYIALVIVLALIVARVFHLHVTNKSYLESQGHARSMRHVKSPAPRGMIVDRHGKVLAVTAPIQSLYINPQQFDFKNAKTDIVLTVLGINASRLRAKVAKYPKSQFMYLKRHLAPNIVKKVLNYDVPGLYALTEYKRFYPDAEVLGPVLGLTNIDGKGIAGLELQYDKLLTGKPGKKIYVKDVKGNVIKVLEETKAVKGQNLQLSIDRQFQHIIYAALVKGAVHNRAVAASAVLLDVKTGEVLAMANYPAFNPNKKSSINAQNQRNRAVTDTFEPGSTMKPIAATAVLRTGKVTPETKVLSDGGVLRIGRRTVRDGRDYGEMDMAFIVKKSSNVGISKLVLSVEPEVLPDTLKDLKFGQKTGIEFPGEAKGVLSRRKLKPFALATLAFGYGVSATNLQLAQAYAILARQGKHITPTLLKRTAKANGEPVLKPYVANQMVKMLEGVLEAGGTGFRAKIKGYKVAGKTGTSRKAGKGGYELDKYIALFAGVAPADNPQYVLVVMVDDPRGDKYYGGSVAAPIFKEAMKKVLSVKR